MSVGRNFPEGKRIAFTGRLASMSRAVAISAVTDRGGFVRDLVSHRTDLLVVGSDGWPLRKSGSLTRNLERASKLQVQGHWVSIISEAEFLRRMCTSDEVHAVRREHTLEQLSGLLGVSGLRLRRWVQLGMIKSNDCSALTPMFDFEQVAAAKTLSRLVARGVPPRKLANSLRRLLQWLPDDGRLGVSIIALEGQLLVRDGDNLIDSVGQLYFAFDRQADEAQSKTSPIAVKSVDPDELFDQADRGAREGCFNGAVTDYQLWLQIFGEDSEVLFNLANIYLQQELISQAIDYFHRCLNVDPTYARAWNNLGLSLYQLGDRSAAIAVLRRATDLDPDNVESMFNLADMLDEAGCGPEARLLWLRIARYRGACNDEIRRYAEQCLGQAAPDVSSNDSSR